MAKAAVTPAEFRPLADRMRPRTLAEFVGQRHLLDSGKPLRQAVDSGLLHYMILWGPPGSGKTTLARLFTAHCHADFIGLSAVLAGVKDIREAEERARCTHTTFQPGTDLFLHE